jgi:hypothetical protein
MVLAVFLRLIRDPGPLTFAHPHLASTFLDDAHDPRGSDGQFHLGCSLIDRLSHNASALRTLSILSVTHEGTYLHLLAVFQFAVHLNLGRVEFQH